MPTYYDGYSNVDHNPTVYPDAAGEVCVYDGYSELNQAMVGAVVLAAAGDLFGMCVLPAGAVVLDFVFGCGDVDEGTDVTWDIGVLNATQDDLVANTNLLTGSTVGQTLSAARATALPAAVIAPSTSERIIAAKLVTRGAALSYATGTITSSGVQVTADDTVTIDTTTTYTFVDGVPQSEGDVHIGDSAAETLDNLKLAINRTDPTTHNGNTYLVTAAHPTVEATTNTDTVQTLQAKTAGAAGNALTLAKSAVTLTVSHDHLENGTDESMTSGGIRGTLYYRATEYGQ